MMELLGAVVALLGAAVGYGFLKGEVRSARESAKLAHDRLDRFEDGVITRIERSLGDVQQGLARIEGHLFRDPTNRTRETDSL